jgi:hypothetical protein
VRPGFANQPSLRATGTVRPVDAAVVAMSKSGEMVPIKTAELGAWAHPDGPAVHWFMISDRYRFGKPRTSGCCTSQVPVEATKGTNGVNNPTTGVAVVVATNPAAQ